MILILLGARIGYAIGITRGISHLIALIATVLTLMLVLMLTASLRAGQSRNTIITIVILVILGSVYGIVKFLLGAARKVSELPLLHQLDKLAGAFAGILWFFIIYMVMIAMSYRGFFGSFGVMVSADVKKSTILSLINQYNILIPR